MSFPTSITSFSTTSGTEVLGNLGSGTGLSGILNFMGVDLNAVETKLGTGASTPAANTILYGTGAGTSAWQGLTSAQLASILSDETGTGSAVFANSPTIVTPTVTSLTNMQHNHSNAAGGGQLTGSTAIAPGTITNALLDTSAGGVGAAWKSFTPTVTYTGGGSNGNAVITGAYIQIGKTVHFWVKFVLGSTTSYSGMTSTVCTLPVTASSAWATGVVNAVGVFGGGCISGGSAYAVISYGITTTNFNPCVLAVGGTYAGANNFTNVIPGTWTVAGSDYWSISGTYEAA